MKTLNSNRHFSYKDLLYKALIFITTTFIIVYFLPKEGKFNYEFDINKPWKYGLLQASFGFPIYKNEQQVQKEQDSILAAYQPYFNIDKEIAGTMQKKLREDYNKNLRNVLPVSNYIRYIERTLDHIYSHGILSIEDAELIAQDSIRNILLIDKNMGSSKPANQLYTIKEAYEHLLDVDTAYYDKRILQLCNLNNYLTPNLIYDKEKSESARQDLLSNISWANGYVLNGQKIIDGDFAPGFFVTNQNRSLLFDAEGNPTARTGKILAATPMKKFGEISDLIGALLWLADDKASGFVTGTVIPVDGGFSAYSGV